MLCSFVSKTPLPDLASDDNTEIQKLKTIGRQAALFCRQNKLNEKICFIADMSIPAGKYRFFIYDLKNETVLNKGIVAHGCCNYSFLPTARFSNIPGSGCSSLGRYRTGEKYNGRFGTAYKLYGLDSSNSNAYKRNIVLHSYYLVPDKEVYPDEICNSLGCIMISKSFLLYLTHLLDVSEKPVLIWVIQ